MSVADFTLKARIEANLWLMYEVTSRMANKTPTEAFVTQLRSEIEGLSNQNDQSGFIKIALIEIENWKAETVTEIIKSKVEKSVKESTDLIAQP